MEKPKSIKDKAALQYIEYLEDSLKKYTASPYYDSYIAIKKMVDDWNHQLSNHRINIFDEADSKKFSMIKSFLKEQKVYTEQIEFFKSKMTADEIKSADDRILSESAVAEKYIFNKEQ